MDRKGVSPVIATVLLLVLTIVIAGVIFSVVLPFVKDILGDSKECLDVLQGVEFPESKFNCYKGTETGFSIKLGKDGISGFRVALTDNAGSSDVVDIKSGMGDVNNLRMVGGSPDIEFPSVGGQRSYVANKKYDKAEISPITKSGEICAMADTVEFVLCDNDVTL